METELREGLRNAGNACDRLGLAGLAALYFEQRPAAALGGVLMLLNWPYTLLVMAATNKTLGGTPDEDGGPTSRALLVRWGKLHFVRTLLGVAAVGAFAFASVAS